MYRITIVVNTNKRSVAEELADIMFTAVMEIDEDVLKERGLPELLPEMAFYVGPNVEESA